MASVYAGEHLVLGHQVAIKVLHPRHLGNDSLERRFFNEARAIAAIKHPSIVEIYDFGRGPDGAAYIVMELLEGENLRHRIRARTLTIDRSISFARQLSLALAKAHDVGVVHRDLKPDNVFIIEDREVEYGERVKLLDFGIAKAMQGIGPASEHTATGILVGTPAYMSPEQCKGIGEIDARSDIYSLGVVLYRMVTNKLPFEAGGTGELIGKHLYVDPTPPIDINPTVGIALNEVILRCLAKKPSDRYQTAVDLAVALANIPADRAAPLPAMRNATGPMPTPSPTPRSKPGSYTPPPYTMASPGLDEETHPTTLRAATGEVAGVYGIEDSVSVRPNRRVGLFAGAAAAVIGAGIVLALAVGNPAEGGDTSPVRPAAGAALPAEGAAVQGAAVTNTAAAVDPDAPDPRTKEIEELRAQLREQEAQLQQSEEEKRKLKKESDELEAKLSKNAAQAKKSKSAAERKRLAKRKRELKREQDRLKKESAKRDAERRKRDADKRRKQKELKRKIEQGEDEKPDETKPKKPKDFSDVSAKPKY